MRESRRVESSMGRERGCEGLANLQSPVVLSILAHLCLINLGSIQPSKAVVYSLKQFSRVFNEGAHELKMSLPDPQD